MRETGGHASHRRQRLEPASKVRASGRSSPGRPFRCVAKNGASISSRKYFAVALSNGISPSRSPGSAVPAPVVPRPDDESVQIARVVLLERVVDRQRAVEVLLVPPAGHVQRRYLDVPDVRDHRLPLPEVVVVRMLDEVVPGRNLSVEEEGVDVGERAQRQVPAVGVVPIEAELLELLSALELVGVFEAVAQAKRSVVVEVVAEPHVGGRGLRRDRRERRVRLERPHDRRPAPVGDSEHPGLAVVARDVLQQPLDRVVRVGPLVEGLLVGRVAGRPLHHERALGAELAAEVLEDEDVSVVRQGLERAVETLTGLGDAVRACAAGGRGGPRSATAA